MFASWRPLPLPAFAFAVALAVALPGSAAQAAGAALDRDALEEMEALLRDLGFDPGPVDGLVDASTLDAIGRYHAFALRPGPPEPSPSLLDELRGVAAAFAALSGGRATPPEPAVSGMPDTEDLAAAPDAEAMDEAAEPEEKRLVPPPPPPQKLTPPEAIMAEVPKAEEPGVEESGPEVPGPDEPGPDEPGAEEPGAEEESLAPPPAAVADSGPEETHRVEPAVEEPAPEEVTPPEAVQAAALPVAPDADGPDTDPAAEAQARIDAELAPYRGQLADGSLTRDDLAWRFNDEGRNLLQQSHYEEAIVKFSVALQLNPNFAGAYSNRGTAYQRLNESERAQADFDKAKELGFGGFRARDGRNPLN